MTDSQRKATRKYLDNNYEKIIDIIWKDEQEQDEQEQDEQEQNAIREIEEFDRMFDDKCRQDLEAMASDDNIPQIEYYSTLFQMWLAYDFIFPMSREEVEAEYEYLRKSDPGTEWRLVY